MEEKNIEESNAGLVAEMENIYTTLEEAKVEIWRRWNDLDLRKRVEDFLKGDIPDILKVSPRAVLSRHVTSPNFELLYFLELSKKTELSPLCLEYIKDKFVSKNKDKYYLGKLFFFNEMGKRGNPVLSALRVVDFNQYDGKKFSDIQTIDGDNLVDFHHLLVSPFVSEKDIFDMSDNFERNGAVARQYYDYILSLFICNGILFESFLLSDVYDELTRDIFLPSYRRVMEVFGLKPLIVRLAPVEREDEVYWRYYPDRIKNKIQEIKNNK